MLTTSAAVPNSFLLVDEVFNGFDNCRGPFLFSPLKAVEGRHPPEARHTVHQQDLL